MSPGDANRWTWFPWGALRGAGFPVEWVDTLRSVSVCEAADALIACDADLEDVSRGARETLRSLDSASRRRRLTRALRAHRAIEEPDLDIADSAARWNAALGRREAALASLLQVYEDERQASTHRLHTLFADDGVRRAVLWQNRRLMANIARGSAAWDVRTLLKYLTRYSTKNDTIGFFGPVVWFRVLDEPGIASFRCGPSLTRRTTLSFEVWPIARIAELLSERADLRPWLSPRRSPLCRVQDGRIFMPPDSAIAATDEDVTLLLRCDGSRTAHDITDGAADAMNRLEALRANGLITWALDCPVQQHPDDAIAQFATRIGDLDRRRDVQAHLDWIQRTEARLRQSMHGSPALDEALRQAEAEFEERYSHAALRSAGQYYAGRTLTYIDCERDVTLALNAGLMSGLMSELLPILLSLRWYTYTVAHRVVDGVAGIVPVGERRPLVSIFPAVMGLIWSTVHVVAAEYRSKWRALLPIDPAVRLVRVGADALTASVAQAFAAPHPGWPMARVHNPDILIAAAGTEALARGDYRALLGEVHASLPSMFQTGVFSSCTEPDAVRDAFKAIAPSPPIINESSPRLNLGEFFTGAAQLWLPDEPVTHARARPVADFDVVHETRGVHVRDVTTHEVWALPAFFDSILSRSTFHIDAFDDSDAPHRPRVQIGNLVVAREAWRIRADELGLSDRRRADRRAACTDFVSVRQWARRHDVPRQVFARSPKEPKPVYLDLESQACVELLSHLLRRAADGPDGPASDAVTLSEMLPAPHECWLHDAQGRRYTSEIRLLAVDPLPYPSLHPGSEML